MSSSKTSSSVVSGKPRYWLGSKIVVCDLCSNPIDKTFVDGSVAGFGSWAIMCSNCHHSHGVGLGTGKGQKYERQSDERWLKTEG